jgi:TolB-like protein
VSEQSHAVFLSYASQDAQAAGRICKALREAGIEVWLDQSELRGGDAWDRSIRRQIKSCALFIPVISRNTHARDEGYFRLEWKLAVDRCHLMAADRTFLLPVVIDDTGDDEERVPDRFREVQWTRLPAGEVPPPFVERVQRLLSPDPAHAIREPMRQAGAVGTLAALLQGFWLPRRWLLAVAAAAVIGAGGYFAIAALRVGQRAVQSPTVGVSAPPAAFSPPPHSIAVLPFVNMSGDSSQEYFSDGLTEELLNSLAQVPELQVAARTSAFSFKGKDSDVATIAHKLNVAAVLEGSVRRSPHTLRITAQLVDAVTGYHLWSQTYDRSLGDVLKLQADIATSVASALKVTLLADTARTIGLGGTSNPAAFDAYLRGRRSGAEAQDTGQTLAAFTEAIRLDPHYALAFAERSMELAYYARFEARGPAIRESFEKAMADAREAISLTPDLAEAHLALAWTLRYGFLEFVRANEELETALSFGPGNARVLSAYSRNAAEMGRTDAAISTGRRAITLDPLNFDVYRKVGITLLTARRYSDAISTLQRAISLRPGYLRLHALLGQTQYLAGNPAAARASCEIAAADEVGQVCLAMVYQRLGRHSDATAALGRLQSSLGDSGACDYAYIYSQWGDVPQALRWLETALRLRDSSLTEVKTAPELDPLRQEPRFQAILKELKFPD